MSLEESPAVLKRLQLKLQDGIPLLEPVTENWEAVVSFQARPEDIVIVTYPKAGTTWIQEIVDLIVTEADMNRSKQVPIHLRCPFLEIWGHPPIASGVQLLSKAPSPRMIKTHLPIQLLPKSIWEQDCKVIYMARNAKDNAVSYYHFHRMCKTMEEPGSWETFISKFMEGKMAWGSWYDHVKGFWAARDKHRILYLFFEDFKENPRREIRKVAKFLGKDLSDERIGTIALSTEFQVMKENPMVNYTFYPSEVFDHSVSAFMRKGLVGDWKTQFTVAQNEVFEEDYCHKMENTSLRFRTDI